MRSVGARHRVEDEVARGLLGLDQLLERVVHHPPGEEPEEERR
jgi:hypothetical protein